MPSLAPRIDTLESTPTFSGAASFAAGSAAAPSLRFTVDPTTGLYRIGAGNIGFTCAGVSAGGINATAWTIGAITGANQLHNINGTLRIIMSGSSGAGAHNAYSGVQFLNGTSAAATQLPYMMSRTGGAASTASALNQVVEVESTLDSGTTPIYSINIGLYNIGTGAETNASTRPLLGIFKADGTTSVLSISAEGACKFGSTAAVNQTHTFQGKSCVVELKATGAGDAVALDFYSNGSPRCRIYTDNTGGLIFYKADFGTQVLSFDTAGAFTFGSASESANVKHIFKGSVGTGFHTTLMVQGSFSANSLSVLAAGTAGGEYTALIYDRNLGDSFLWVNRNGAPVFRFASTTTNTWSSLVSSMAGYLECGSFNVNTGAWSIGPGDAATAIQIQTINGKINNQISNGSFIYRTTGNFQSSATVATTVLNYTGSADSGTNVMITLRVTQSGGGGASSLVEYYATITGGGASTAVSAGTTLVAGGQAIGTFAWSGTNLQFTRGGSTDTWYVDIVVSRRNVGITVNIQ